MAMAMTVKCAKCDKSHNIYADIQKQYGKESIVGVCPWCGYVTGHFFKQKFTFDYNAGDGENGVPSKQEEV